MKKSIHSMLGLTGKALAIYLAVEVLASIVAIVAAFGYAIYKVVHHH
jgi:hypothetical protein